MSADDIVSVKQAFVQAAIRAQRAGYAAIEIHAAHGYLISEFLSPGINLRDDEYGGSFENRTRFLKEILSEIKTAVQIPVGVRISAQSWVKGDWSLEDSVRLAKELEALGAAFIHVSAGGFFERTDSAPAFTPLYQARYAKAVKQAVGIPVIAVGLIIGIFIKRHDQIELKITELKNLLIKYYTAPTGYEMTAVLNDIFAVEVDLAGHNYIEDAIFTPFIEYLESQQA